MRIASWRRSVAERPLVGRHIVVTRPREQSESLAAALRRLGAEVSIVPLIRIDPVADVEQLKASMHGRHHYDWLVITSANTVRALAGWPGLLRLARNAQVAAVGPATADALRRMGIEPDFVPERHSGDQIVSGLGSLAGARVLVTQSDISDTQLCDQLRRGGAHVQPIHAYRTAEVERESDELAELRAADAVVLMSGSAARSLASQGGAGGSLVVCIGPKTAAVAAEVGLDVGLVADEATADGIIRALVAHFGEST